MERQSVQQYYATNAGHYDLLMAPFAHVRAQAITTLQLSSGSRVLEVGCGTGTSFAALRRLVGDRGHLIGVDYSLAMIRHARKKAARAAWDNVTTINADAVRLPLGATLLADAVLVFYSNDVITNPVMIDQLLTMLRPGGRIAIAGARLTDGIAGGLLNPLTRTYARRGMLSQLTQRPWEHLEARLGPLHVQTMLFGTAFVASGTAQATRAVALQ